MNLIAVGVLAEQIENGYSRLSAGNKWEKMGEATLAHLMMDTQALTELTNEARDLLEESGL